MKKLLVFFSVGVLVAGIIGCGRSDAPQGSSQPDTSQESSQPESEQQSTESSADQNTSQPPESGGEQTGTVVNGYDYLNGWTEEMQGMRGKVTEALGENYWPEEALLPDVLEMLVGLTPDMYDDYMAEAPMMSTNVDMLIVVKAKEGREEEVEGVLNAYRDRNVSDTMQYPMNLGKIQASKVVRHGRYVFFVQLGGDTMEALDSGDEAVVKQCEEANDQVIEILSQYVDAQP